jgi:hypothetical protein
VRGVFFVLKLIYSSVAGFDETSGVSVSGDFVGVMIAFV